jgi:hypothetical protein
MNLGLALKGVGGGPASSGGGAVVGGVLLLGHVPAANQPALSFVLRSVHCALRICCARRTTDLPGL